MTRLLTLALAAPALAALTACAAPPPPPFATGAQGAMTGAAYIQRVTTVGGMAPSRVCDVAGVGRREIVKYQADYLLWQLG